LGRGGVARWRSSGLSVEAFCQLEGVTRSGFYRWETKDTLKSENSDCFSGRFLTDVVF